MITIYSGILFSLTTKGNPAMCNSMDDPGGHMLSEIRQSQMEKYCMISVTCDIRNSQNYRSSDEDVACQGLRGGRSRELLFNGHKLSVI